MEKIEFYQRIYKIFYRKVRVEKIEFYQSPRSSKIIENI